MPLATWGKNTTAEEVATELKDSIQGKNGAFNIRF